MSWSGWASIAVLMVVNIVLIAKAWGYLQKQIEAIVETHGRDYERIARQITRLELHIEDSDMHWTTRERDALAIEMEKLSTNTKRVEELIMEALTERANIVKVLTSLMDRTDRKQLDK
jgi:hypothetical protein